jgi:hypothetical protein
VIDDEDDLIFEQPWVDGVTNETGAGHRVIDLEVPIVVPGECRDPIASLQAQPTQRVGELTGASECIPIGVAVSRIVGSDLNDLPPRMLQLRMARDSADEQRPVHHLSEHGRPPNDALVVSKEIPQMPSRRSTRRAT